MTGPTIGGLTRDQIVELMNARLGPPIIGERHESYLLRAVRTMFEVTSDVLIAAAAKRLRSQRRPAKVRRPVRRPTRP